MKELIKKTLIRTPTWVFLLLFLTSGIICIFSLRYNNETMVKLRSAVYEADKNNGDVNTTLNDLRKYVYSHMNTNLSSGGNAIKPPIQLKYAYERLQSNEQKRVDSANTNVYTQAQVYCQQQNSVDFSGRNRVPCVQDYVTTHGEKANTVPAALYQYDFVSPTWSPDLAGWSMVLSALLFVLFISSFIIDRLVGSKIKNNIG
jgi:preprotein translocase subunit SecF